jgi:hypothetical protein
LITDAQNKEVFKIQMQSKTFALNFTEEEQAAVQCFGIKYWGIFIIQLYSL